MVRFTPKPTNPDLKDIELRDYLAAKAMSEMVGLDTRIMKKDVEASIAKRAYGIADAMLKERESE